MGLLNVFKKIGDVANNLKSDVETCKDYFQEFSDDDLLDMLCKNRYNIGELKSRNGKSYNKLARACAVNMVLKERGYSQEDIDLIVKFGR